MDNIFDYYLIDWIGIVLGLVGVHMLGNKNKWGFIIFALSNLLWLFLGAFWMNSSGMIVGNFIFMLINMRGFINWSKNHPDIQAV